MSGVACLIIPDAESYGHATPDSIVSSIPAPAGLELMTISSYLSGSGDLRDKKGNYDRRKNAHKESNL